MTTEQPAPPRLLVTIASFGTSHDSFLQRLVEEYQSMSYHVDIVVLSNIQKKVPPGSELIVGLPTKDPWSLPFAHKKVLADRLEEYDLFIYSEDDTLATEENIEAFVTISTELPENEIAGYLRYENVPGGTINYCDVNGHYHWDPSKILRRGENIFGFHSNEHAAFYLLTREQLRKAIASGGFLVPPHRGKYDLACSAATDPYTQCGFKKLVCISNINPFLLHHLPDKYVGTKFGTHASLMDKQVTTLLKLEASGSAPYSLFNTESRLRDAWYSKDYYEPIRPEVLSAVPESAVTILSIGCGSGEAEKWLASSGKKVVAIPIDPIIGSCAQGDGIEMVYGSFSETYSKLRGRQFDCLYFSEILHLLPNPIEILAMFASCLRPGGTVVAKVPNVARVKNLLGKIRGHEAYRDMGSYEKTGVQFASHRLVRRWFGQVGLKVEKITDLFSPSTARYSRMTLGLLDSLLSNEFVVIATKPEVK